VEAAYRRGDMLEKRRRLMQDWAAFCGMATAKGVTAAGSTQVGEQHPEAQPLRQQ
jgi:hypothetical protein